MADSLNTLSKMSAALRRAPAALERCMPKLQAATEEYLKDCYAAGVSPDGQPWPLNEDGSKSALTGAEVRVAFVRSRIVVEVRAHNALHSLGYARGGKVRAMLPSGPVPAKLLARWQDIVSDALAQELTQ